MTATSAVPKVRSPSLEAGFAADAGPVSDGGRSSGRPSLARPVFRRSREPFLIPLLLPLQTAREHQMWIRRTRRRWLTKDGWHEAVYYFVVESYRDTEGRPRQRTIEALGSDPPSSYLPYWKDRLRLTRAEVRRWAAEASDEILPERRRRAEARVAFYEEESKIARARIKWYQGLQRIFENPRDPANRGRRLERPGLTVLEATAGKRAPINPYVSGSAEALAWERGHAAWRQSVAMPSRARTSTPGTNQGRGDDRAP